jgi:hypothetical protein
MNSVVALSAHTGVRLAEAGYLLILFAGVWIVAARDPQFGDQPGTKMIVAGASLAVAGLLLIVATHSGHYGQP